MRIAYVKFAALRIVKQFENDRIEVTVEVGPEDDPDAAYAMARTFVYSKLQDRAKRQEEEQKILSDREESIASRPLDMGGDVPRFAPRSIGVERGVRGTGTSRKR